MSDTPRTDVEYNRIESNQQDYNNFELCYSAMIDFARQLERELGEATKQSDVYKVNCQFAQHQFNALRAGVEKLAAEYTHLADTSDDEDFITEKRALARELRVLLK